MDSIAEKTGYKYNSIQHLPKHETAHSKLSYRENYGGAGKGKRWRRRPDLFGYDAGGHRDRRTLGGGANNDHCY
jgi:hypothetical protein